MNKTTAKKVASIAGNVLTYLFLALALLSIMLSIFSRRDSDGAVTVFGTQLRFVASDSMEKCEATDVSQYEIGSIRIRSLLFIETVPEDEEAALEWYGKVKVGDVLTFKYVYTKQETVTHRVTGIETYENGYVFTLEGDNRSTESAVLKQVVDTRQADSPNYVVGKVKSVNYPIGVVVTALKEPVCIVLLIIVPCVIIAVLEIIRVVGILTAEKRARAAEEAEAKEKEIEELKKRLAALESDRTEETEGIEETEETESK